MINIGDRPASDFTDPLGVLRDCHRRVERFLDLLMTVTEQAQGGPLNAEQREAFATALRYFADAAPKHTQDEEDSLFPRLRATKAAGVAAALALVERLEHDHERAAPCHATVDALGRQWLAEDRLPPAACGELRDRLRDLEAIYRRHIAIEDGELYPLAAILLAPRDLAALGREMAARRGVSLERTAAV